MIGSPPDGRGSHPRLVHVAPTRSPGRSYGLPPGSHVDPGPGVFPPLPGLLRFLAPRTGLGPAGPPGFSNGRSRPCPAPSGAAGRRRPTFHDVELPPAIPPPPAPSSSSPRRSPLPGRGKKKKGGAPPEKGGFLTADWPGGPRHRGDGGVWISCRVWASIPRRTRCIPGLNQGDGHSSRPARPGLPDAVARSSPQAEGTFEIHHMAHVGRCPAPWPATSVATRMSVFPARKAFMTRPLIWEKPPVRGHPIPPVSAASRPGCPLRFRVRQ